VSEEASLSSRQYSLLHLTHLRMKSSLQLMHYSLLVCLLRMNQDMDIPYDRNQSNHVERRLPVSVHVSLFSCSRSSTYLGALGPDLQGRYPGVRSKASRGDWCPESNYVVTASRKSRGCTRQGMSSHPHMPLLPAPAIISLTRHWSTQRPICTFIVCLGIILVVPLVSSVSVTSVC
jgi:hypothetical protein